LPNRRLAAAAGGGERWRAVADSNRDEEREERGFHRFDSFFDSRIENQIFFYSQILSKIVS